MKHRGRGDGTIRQRRNGLWEASIRYVDPLTLRHARLSLYAATRAEVNDKLASAKVALAERRPPKDEAIRLDAFLRVWLEDVVKPTKREATYRSYKTVIDKHLAPSRIGAVHLRDLREVQIQHELIARAKGPSRTQQLSLIVLKAALDQAVRWQFLTVNPAGELEIPKPPARELRPLSANEARRFLAAARDDRLFALYYLAIDTGLRQGELLALEWRDVDLEAGTLRVVRSLDNHTGKVGPLKTRASRRVLELGAATVALLRAHAAPGRLLFPNACGRHLSPQNVRNRSFLPLQAAAGIDPPIRFHDLRHTCATLMLSAGVHPKIVSERLGHATVAITMDTYQHVLPSMQRAIAGRIGDLLAVAEGGSAGGTRAKVVDLSTARKRRKPR